MMEEHVRASRVRYQEEQKKEGKQVREVRCARGHAKRAYFYLDLAGEAILSDDSMKCPKCRDMVVKHWPFEDDEPKAAEPVAEQPAEAADGEGAEEGAEEEGAEVARPRRKAQSKKRRSRRRKTMEEQENDG